jgi:hypothetical protein
MRSVKPYTRSIQAILKAGEQEANDDIRDEGIEFAQRVVASYRSRGGSDSLFATAYAEVVTRYSA